MVPHSQLNAVIAGVRTSPEREIWGNMIGGQRFRLALLFSECLWSVMFFDERSLYFLSAMKATKRGTAMERGVTDKSDANGEVQKNWD